MGEDILEKSVNSKIWKIFCKRIVGSQMTPKCLIWQEIEKNWPKMAVFRHRFVVVDC